MASKSGIQATIDSIFLAAMDLFKEQGFSKTNVRQIAERAGVSLGLVNHHFGSKRDLGYAVLETLIKYVVIHTEKHPLCQENMLLLDAVETRSVNLFLTSGPFRQFYLDTLDEDIFFSYLEHQPISLLETLQDEYHFSISHDMALLYSRYIPYMVEKTLVLKKEENLFPSIGSEEIPYQIFIAPYSGRIPQQILCEADQQARGISLDIISHLSLVPDKECLASVGLLPLKLHG